MALSSRSPVLSAEFRLLLLLSRLVLDEVQTSAACNLCKEVNDWEAVRHMAMDRFILPVVYRHLRHLEPFSLPAEQLALMKYQVMALYRHDLNVIANLAEIHEQLLLPLEIPYVTFKGPSLAVCYYDEPAMRFSRDIDILVPRERMAELLARALAAGYKPLVPHDLGNDSVSLAFVARYQKVITLLSPRDIVIEFHSQIDNIGTVYDTRALIDRAEPTRVGSAEVSVLPTDELFVYICWHHTKHFWSHLHWLVDLDAIQRHPSFDRQRAYSCAERHGLSSTVEVCVKMAELLGSPEFVPHDNHDERLNGLLKLSLEAMQGDLLFEHHLSSLKATPDYAFHWQTDLRHRLRWKLLGWLRRFRPSYAEYRVRPLPSGWQWLYCFLRPLLACRRRLINHNSD
ncbi:nucleotidyltransferase family protein [Halomonas sp. BC04]|uniref:nucleotidyltransferase family protein n=1 Tax=Halomonas sp. BC04 TaxID=1403540 RepID=UPI0009DDC417|nr:nucleotidyltransferase family protein [Halomonas sp. BC04]